MKLLKFWAFFMALLVFSMPFVARAQQQPQQVTQELASAEAEAETDANRDVNKPLYFGLGCLLTGIPILTSIVVDNSDLADYLSSSVPALAILGMYYHRPNPPVSRLIGKSPAYINTYTSHYKSRRGRIQANWASAGCLTGGGVLGALILGAWLGMSGTETSN